MKRKGSAGQSGGKVKAGVKWFKFDDKRVLERTKAAVLSSNQRRKRNK